MPSAPQIVIDLVARFDRNAETYKSPAFNETELRVELVNPLWKALGWDMDNEAGNAMAYRDVIHEDAIRIGSSMKAPDYCFRIGGMRKFFLETKKPAVNLKNDPSPAYQLRRYGWSAKLPVSVLTDFEEMAVYDCRIRPKASDKASVGRMTYYTYREYLERWDEIVGVFSREAVLKGSFDKYVDSTRNKRGASEVDEEFLKEIERWRELLAKDIALHNPSLDVRGLNFAVGKTIDRIIFLRMCEDRGIEMYGQLLALSGGARIYPRLLEVYRRADEKYNSGLFHFNEEKDRIEAPDTLTPRLKIDDKPLKEILSRLYYPESPYEFSILPTEILGNVYEQFLGKVIRLTAGHHAKIEEKPEVRKAGGVYYTPAYIVEYIVKNTVGRLCEGKTPREVSKFRILDPACGSGSFLLGAYQYLLDWHLGWYTDEMRKTGAAPKSPPAEGKRPRKGDPNAIYETRRGWLLTTAEKKRILLNNLYGVDIDAQAVEVTKLSLLLKVLEYENAETLKNQLTLWRERALPDLADNIKCGNSLIAATDFRASLFPDAEEMRRINPFDWASEFDDIMRPGGFDAIIGNPPYLNIQHVSEQDRAILTKKYQTPRKRFDIYGLFIELSTRLLRTDGLVGVIIPSTILNNLSFAELRRLLVERTRILTLVNLGGRVFQGVNNDTLIIVAAMGAHAGHQTAILDVVGYGEKLRTAVPLGDVDLQELARAPEYAIPLRVDSRSAAIFKKMERAGTRVGAVAICFQGFVTGGNDAYIVTRATIREEALETAVCKPAVFGDEIGRYEPPCPKYEVLYLTRHSSLDDYPRVRKHLMPYKEVLECKREVRMGRQPWFALHWARNQSNFERPEKILVQAIRNLSLARRVVATLDTRCLYADHTLNVLYMTAPHCDVRLLLGVLNSSLVNYWFRKQHLDINIKGVYLEALPFPAALTRDESPEKHRERMLELVVQALQACAATETARTPGEKETANRRMKAVDEEIDTVVFDLYGLSKEERALVQVDLHS